MRYCLNKLTQNDGLKLSVLLNIQIANKKFHNFNDLSIRCMYVSTSNMYSYVRPVHEPKLANHQSQNIQISI